MKLRWITGALLGLVAAWPATASICTAPTEPSIAPIPRAYWEDIAKFAFLVGNDFDGSQGNMQLTARLRTFGSFATLRTNSAAWRDTRAQSVTLAGQLINLEVTLLALANLCQQLDDAGIGGKKLDSVLWTQKMDLIRHILATTVMNLQGGMPPNSFRTALENFALTAANAAQSYTDARFPEPYVLPIRPNPVQTANQIGEVWGRWRVIIVDLARVADTMPQRPDPDSEKVLSDIAAAMPLLARTIAAARSIQAQDISPRDFEHLISGDYLYDACAISENINYYLYTARYSLTALIRDPTSTNLVVGYATAPIWQFRRVGMGFWQILSTDNTSLVADNDNAASHPLKVIPIKSEGSLRSGQYWRCFETPQPGHYRFVNQLFGEAWSMGVDKVADGNGRIRVNMIQTVNESEQYWAAWER